MKEKRVKKPEALVDTKALRLKIKESGLRLEHIIKALGMTYVTLQKRIDGKQAFTVPEMVQLCGILNIDEASRNAIFKL